MNSPESAEDFVPVATFVFPYEAQLARAELESEQIPCFLNNERTLDIDWLLINMIGGYQLFVPASSADRARAILASRVSDEDLEAQAAASVPRSPDL